MLCITNQDQRHFVIFGIFVISLSLDFIVAHVADAKYFAIMADETTDVSQKEQMTLVIRYVDKDLVVREDFLGFVQVTDSLVVLNGCTSTVAI